MKVRIVVSHGPIVGHTRGGSVEVQRSGTFEAEEYDYGFVQGNTVFPLTIRRDPRVSITIIT